MKLFNTKQKIFETLRVKYPHQKNPLRWQFFAHYQNTPPPHTQKKTQQTHKTQKNPTQQPKLLQIQKASFLPIASPGFVPTTS